MTSWGQISCQQNATGFPLEFRKIVSAKQNGID
jgi:hypothetical protein